MQNLREQLDTLIGDIDRLIDLTYADIELVKRARHAEITEHHHQKRLLISRFERNKNLLNETLRQMTLHHPEKPISEVLPDEERQRLDRFKEKLQELHEANRIYGKFVVSLNEFFTSLVSAILPMKEEGYHPTQPKPAAFLRVSA